MRYRRLSYRYATVSLPGEQWEWSKSVRSDQSQVRLGRTAWRPSADIHETETSVVVTVELAGVDQEDLDVLLFEDALIVEGQRRLPPATPGLYHRVEIRQGAFRLELPLPATRDLERIDATYDRGLLQITFPKTDVR